MPENLAPRWEPGESGNPSGRPKMPDEWRKLLRGPLTKKALEVYQTVLDNEEITAGDRVRCATAVLDRAWGKTPIIDDDGRVQGGIIMIVTHDDMEGV